VINHTTILVVDDEPDIRESVSDILQDEGYRVLLAENGNQARQIFEQQHPDLLLLDIWMPGMDGISLLKECMQKKPDTRIIMMSGHGTVETAIEATRHGAVNYIEKPLSMSKLILSVKTALGHDEQDSKVLLNLPERIGSVGHSQTIQNLQQNIRQSAQHSKHILVRGENGSGRSMWSQILHASSPRGNRPLIEVDAHWLQQQGWHEQLYGIEQNGKFIPGLLEKSAGGTLLLCDLENLQQEGRAALLELMETGTYRRVHGQQNIPLNSRLILTENIHAISLTEIDPNNWLQVINIPPLRNHNADIPELITLFVEQIVSHEQLPFRRFAVSAQNHMRYYAWPGNVSQLKRVVRQLLATVDEDVIEEHHVAKLLAINPSTQDRASLTAYFDQPLREAREQFERDYFLHQLQINGGNISKLAQVAGMERTHLYRKLRSLGVNIKHEKNSK